VLDLCWWESAEGPWVLDVLRWRAWCGGDSGDDWVEVLLSFQLQKSESLRRSVRGTRSGQDQWFHRFYGRRFMLKLHWDRRVDDRVCGLRKMVSWWSSRCCSNLQRAATFYVAHHRV
jgi:hypothetical protein